MRTQFIILTLLAAISGVIPKRTKPRPYTWLVLTGGRRPDGGYFNSSEMVGYIGGCPEPKSIPALEVETSKGQSVWSEKKLVFCGGAQNKEPAADTCFSIDKPDETEWTSFPTMTSKRALFSLTIMNNKPTDQLLAVGGVGEDGTCLNTMERYIFPQNEWKALPYTIKTSFGDPVPTCGHCAVRLGLKTVMIIGGGDDANSIYATDRTWKINLNKAHKKKSGHVKPLQRLPKPLWLPACARRGGFVYVSGGRQLDGTKSTAVYEYNIGKNSWLQVGDMTTARYGHVMGNTAKEQMVVAGGYNGGYLKSIEDTYDNGATWAERTLQPLAEERWYSAMAQVPAFMFNCYE